jgi:hypothetical protein
MRARVAISSDVTSAGGRGVEVPRSELTKLQTASLVPARSPCSVMESLDMITISKRSRADDAFAQRKFFKKTAKGKVLKGRSASALPSIPPLALSSPLAMLPPLPAQM